MKDEDIDWSQAYTAKDVVRPAVRPRMELIDPEVSRIVGRPVLATDPKLMKLVVKYKRRNQSETTPDNHLFNPEFLTELKKLYSEA